MGLTTDSLYETFSRELAALHGKSHLASSTIEVAHIISNVAAEAGCTRIIKDRLLLDDEDLIRAELEAHGFRVVDLNNIPDPVAELTGADLSITRDATRPRRKDGLEVKVIETGTCCGMGGTFGLKTGELGYELSTEVGKPLFDLFKAGEVDFGLTQSSVCTMQLEQGTGLPFEHPVALLHAAITGDKDYVERTITH